MYAAGGAAAMAGTSIANAGPAPLMPVPVLKTRTKAMKMTLHGTWLVQLTRFPNVFPVNCYLVREDDGFTLIDAALPGSSHRILAAARMLGAPIVRIALTHAHSDHVGSLDALRAALPGVEILVPEREARFLSGDMRLRAHEPAVKLRGGWQVCTTRPTRLLLPGDRVGALTVIAAPGHTPGHVAFLDGRDGSLIAGDAFQTRGGIAVSGTLRPRFPFPALATWHKPTALASARGLRVQRRLQLEGALPHGRSALPHSRYRWLTRNTRRAIDFLLEMSEGAVSS
jgi:glyoxylase-like metal-dependent hydrolase (beta-lactamase superfamily II)